MNVDWIVINNLLGQLYTVSAIIYSLTNQYVWVITKMF